MRQLEAFRAVMQQQTISGAAETLNLSQPAVSKLIANLEGHLQFPLFHRDKKRISPTTEAYVFLKEVDETFNRFDHLRETAEALRQTRNEVIRVGAMAMVGLTIMPQVIWEFQTMRPKAQVSLQIRLSQNLVDLVGSGQLDAAISQASHEVVGVHSEILQICRAVCVLPNTHRLARREQLSLADIADEPLISLTDGAELRESINRSFASAGLKPNILTTVQLAMAACQFVRITGGLTIVDPITANSPNNVDLVICPIVEKIDVPIYLYTSAGTIRTQGLEQFIAYCRQRFSMLVI